MTVRYEVAGRRATVRLERPAVLNALDRATLDQLALRFGQAATDDRVGVVVLTGTGERAFCTGADLAEQRAFLERPNDYWAWMGHFIAAVNAIRDCPKPVVARLNGMVVGGGNELNLACDLAVGVEDSFIRHVGPSRGSLPSGGATQWLPIFVGDRRAREILLLNEEIPMPRAVEWGLVTRSVPRAELDATVDELCAALLAKLPEIVRATKAQLDFWKDLSWSLTIRMARDWLTLHAASDEVRAGLAAFEEKQALDYEVLRSRLAPPAAADAGRAQAAPPRSAPDGERHCPFCGRGPLPRDTVFCGYCGQPLLGS
ncbi:MAG: enoyl-CoA hydratase-related protein [Candidatus Limnocylindrales bacterium]